MNDTMTRFSIRLTLLVTAILVLAACAQPIRTTTPQAVALTLIDAGALVLDVRTASEFNGGHVLGALNTPVGETDAMVNAIGADRQSLVVVYCGSGRRASIAQSDLAERGYYNIHNGTSFQALREAGARISTDSGNDS